MNWRKGFLWDWEKLRSQVLLTKFLERELHKGVWHLPHHTRVVLWVNNSKKGKTWTLCNFFKNFCRPPTWKRERGGLGGWLRRFANYFTNTRFLLYAVPFGAELYVRRGFLKDDVTSLRKVISSVMTESSSELFVRLKILTGIGLFF